MKEIVIRMLVTFVQAGLGYLVVADGINKAVIAGAIGAGLSAVYNAYREMKK